MSRVLARSMFKKNAPKRSAKGVGITSMLEDDVAGYAEGGEVTDDRTERERLARQLLEQGRDEGDMYQRFSEQERPRMYRPPATAGMVMPQPNPQQVQAMQMQQMAQMGMLPRFQEGGEVQAAVEVPSMWSKMRQGIGSAIGMRGRSTPMFARGTGPEIYASPLGSNIGSPAMDNPEFSIPSENILARMYREPGYRPPAGMDTPVIDARVNPAGLGFAMTDLPLPEGGGRNLLSELGSSDLGKIPASVLGLPQFTERAPPSEEDQARMEADREARRAKGLSNLPFKPTPKEQAREERGPGAGGAGGAGKATDLGDIKSEREAKAAAARQENIYLALMQAGLAIAGGKSSNAITNIGQGGQAGLASFMALEQQRRRDEDAAMRRDLAEREFGLQQRRLNMMAPVYQAQAMAPAIRAQIAAARTQAELNKALGNARLQAIRDVRSEVQKNPMNYTGKDGKPDQLKIQTAIAERQREYAQTRGGSMPSSSGGMGGLGLDLPDEYDLGD